MRAMSLKGDLNSESGNANSPTTVMPRRAQPDSILLKLERKLFAQVDIASLVFPESHSAFLCSEW